MFDNDLSKKGKAVKCQILLSLIGHGHLIFELEYLPFASEKAANPNEGFILKKICCFNPIHIISMVFNKSLGLFGHINIQG